MQHAAAQRSVSDPTLVEVELVGGIVGFGETLARTYVTGEDADSVVSAIGRTFIPVLLDFRADTFAEALEQIDALPRTDSDGRLVFAARAAVELALLDGAMRKFHRSIDDVAQWLGVTQLSWPGSIRSIRFSGVIATEQDERARRQIRMMYWGGIRHFKLKVGMAGDQDRVRWVCRYLSRAISSGKASVRVDANGAWNLEEAAEWLSLMSDVPLAGIEQPLPRGEEDSLPDLHGGSDAGLIHDESLVTEEDAKRLVESGVADAFNIRISKCGGLIPSLRIAALARKNGVRVQLGCMVGETSLLSAAGLRFLEVVPEVIWAEGCFGSFLMGGDVVSHGLRFGLGGRPPKLAGPGLGVEPRIDLIRKWSVTDTNEYRF